MKRFNNKTLIVILVILAGAFVLTRVLRAPGRESNLDVSVFAFDTAGIDQVKLFPVAEDRREIILTKDGNSWRVARDGRTSAANRDLVTAMLDRLASLKPERMVSRKAEKRDDYQVGDTTGIEVIALSGAKQRARVRIGKDGAGGTFARRGDDDEIYIVSGPVASTFNRTFNDWRDQTFLRISANDIREITFAYPADSGFVLTRKGGSWMAGNAPADSAKAQTYLEKLRLRKISRFADSFTGNTAPDVTVTIDADGATAVVRGWRASPSDWILTSDSQPGVYFSDEGGSVARDIFRGRAHFTQ